MLSFLIIVLLSLTALGFFVWYVVAAPASQVLGKTLACGRPTSPQIALTFDDGPGEATPQILELLKKSGARAAFFLCGQNVERFPELARQIAAAGHEIGNHTYSHPRLLWKTPGYIALEINRAQNVIAHHTNQRPQLFRPPYGLRWFGLFPILSRYSMTAVMWSVDGLDWKLPASKITDRILAQARPGSIVLLHDGIPPRESGNRTPTVEALAQILQSLKGQYRFVTVSEMFGGESLSEPRLP